jgi:hypothetical protein
MVSGGLGLTILFGEGAKHARLVLTASLSFLLTVLSFHSFLFIDVAPPSLGIALSPFRFLECDSVGGDISQISAADSVVR